MEYARLTGEESVIDGYCIGTISPFLAQHTKKIYGVEIVKEAIEDECANPVLKGMEHVEFWGGASESVISRWKE